MAMQFNVMTAASVAQSCLDFGYQFGLNDNSTQYFNYTDYSVISNATTNIEASMTHTMFESTLLSGFPKDTIVGIEISSVPIVNLQWTGTLSMNKVSTEMAKEYAGHGALAMDIAMTTLNTLGSIGSTLSSATGTNADWAGFAMAATQFGMQVASTWLTVVDEKKTTEMYSRWVDKQVELYNEKTEANYEFIQQAKEEFNRRSERYNASSQVINSKQKSRSKSF